MKNHTGTQKQPRPARHFAVFPPDASSHRGRGSLCASDMGAAGCASEAERTHPLSRRAFRPAGSPSPASLSGPRGGHPHFPTLQPAICSTSPAASPTQGDGRSNDPTKCKRADRLAARAGGAVDSEDARAAGSTSTTWRQPGRHRAGEAHAFYDVGTDNASQVPAHASGRRTVPILHRSAPAVCRSAGYRRAA
jgi:hypothetical protein